jgi:fatty acid desaturase
MATQRGTEEESAGGVSTPLEQSERLWREHLTQLVDADQLQAYGKQSLSDTVASIGVVWLEVIALLVVANLLPHLVLGLAIPLGIVVVILMGLRMNAFGVIIHEAAHGSLAKSRPLNDRICNWAVAFWTINSVEEYRPTHRLHHRYLGQERDPDRVFYFVPAHRGALTSVILQDLLGITAFKRATTRISGTSQASGAPASLLAKPHLLVGKVVTQLIVLGQFILFQGLALGVVFYVVFWLIPIVCLFPMLVRLKTFTEHFDPALRQANSSHWIARTSCAGWLQNHVIGARMEYHFEHHVFPAIPFRGLQRLHEHLDETGLFVQQQELLSGGYVQFTTRAVMNSFGKQSATAQAAG